MYEFLERLQGADIRSLYEGLDDTWNTRAAGLNRRLEAGELPVRIENLSTIWTICYRQPSPYNWMFQYYLREAGIALSWVGTGRLIFSLNYTAAQFAEVADRLLAAARAMQADGWWWEHPAATNESIKRRVLKEMIQARSPFVAGSISSPRSR
jgi:glutamate-1-semialdehyde 2,1-aminomutase